MQLSVVISLIAIGLGTGCTKINEFYCDDRTPCRYTAYPYCEAHYCVATPSMTDAAVDADNNTDAPVDGPMDSSADAPVKLDGQTDANPSNDGPSSNDGSSWDGNDAPSGDAFVDGVSSGGDGSSTDGG